MISLIGVVYRVFSCIQCVFSVYSVCIQCVFRTKKFRLPEKRSPVRFLSFKLVRNSQYRLHNPIKNLVSLEFVLRSHTAWERANTYRLEGEIPLYQELPDELSRTFVTPILFSSRRNFFVLNTY